MTVEASGTLTTDGTEQTTGTVATARILTVYIDTNAMAAGDSIRIRAKRRILTAGTDRTLWEEVLTGPQTIPIFTVPPWSSPFQSLVTVQRIAGTDRAYPWSIESI